MNTLLTDNGTDEERHANNKQSARKEMEFLEVPVVAVAHRRSIVSLGLQIDNPLSRVPKYPPCHQRERRQHEANSKQIAQSKANSMRLRMRAHWMRNCQRIPRGDRRMRLRVRVVSHVKAGPGNRSTHVLSPLTARKCCQLATTTSASAQLAVIVKAR